MLLNLVFIVRINSEDQYYNLENADIFDDTRSGTGTTLKILGLQSEYWNARVLYEQDMTVQCHYSGHCNNCDRYLGQSWLVSQDVTHLVLVENWQDYKDRNPLSQRGIIYDNAIPYNCCSMLILYRGLSFYSTV